MQSTLQGKLLWKSHYFPRYLCYKFNEYLLVLYFDTFSWKEYAQNKNVSRTQIIITILT